MAEDRRTVQDMLEAKHPRRKARGQRVSQERGSHTRSKKNPGKRAHKGGN